MKLPISLIILTRDEEVNIRKCLESVKDWVSEIIVVDSMSTDKTAEIAKGYGARVVEHDFVNQAQQFNWALDTQKIKNEWILRLDADEEVPEELWEEIEKKLPEAPADVSGFYIKRRVYFMGRWIKHGGYYPTWILRLFRNGKGKSEDREMDEHIILLKGRAEKLENDFIDRNNKNLSFWIDKHNKFASREVLEIMKAAEHRSAGAPEGPPGERRKAKQRYYELPMFFRALLYFLNRYFLKLGFLDGKEGLIFHVLQGFWYRFLIDAKLYENGKIKNQNAK